MNAVLSKGAPVAVDLLARQACEDWGHEWSDVGACTQKLRCKRCGLLHKEAAE
jgi:hypothetical protein